jgi:SulP family sulfate permease
LAALIVVALIKKVLDIADFWKLFKKSKLDGLAWLITFLGCIVFDVDIGLYIGLVSTLLLMVFKSQRARSTLLGNIPGTNIFECVDTCHEAREYKHIKIIRYEESVYYANVDNFKYKVMKLAGVKPSEILSEIERDCKAEFKHIEKMAAKQKKLLKNGLSTRNLDFAGYIFDKVSYIIGIFIFFNLNENRFKNIFILL